MGRGKDNVMRITFHILRGGGKGKEQKGAKGDFLRRE